MFYCYCRQNYNSLVQNYAVLNPSQYIYQWLIKKKKNDPGSVSKALRIDNLIRNIANFREDISNGEYLTGDHIKIFHQVVANNTCFKPVNVFLIGAFVVALPAS